MKVDVLLGLQWGDEGKGKVVDVLTPNYDLITRFQGEERNLFYALSHREFFRVIKSTLSVTV